MIKNEVGVIIAAYNAASTIQTAIRSALNENEVTEVIVVDDASGDDTVKAAHNADDGTGRLQVLKVRSNIGPSGARNLALKCSKAPYICVLDSDDFFLPQRFEALFREKDWDFVADNIAFFQEGSVVDVSRIIHQEPMLDGEELHAIRFVMDNISKRGVRRAELGFLKPLISRAFLDKHNLRFRETLRLGEDYELFTRAFIHNARFKIIRSCGYGALTRNGSLSGQHSTEDLLCLVEADQAILKMPEISPELRNAVRKHASHVRQKYLLRHFLGQKSEKGLFTALWQGMVNPVELVQVLKGVGNDKVETLMKTIQKPVPTHNSSVRMLLSSDRSLR